MKITALKSRPNLVQGKRCAKRYGLFEKLIIELEQHELPIEIITTLNSEITHLNSLKDTDKAISKDVKRVQYKLLKSLEKELKLVPINHYRNMWLALGMSLGLSFGTVFATSIQNYAFIGVGMPIGMAIGIALGTKKDKEVKESGRQLGIELF